MTERRVVVYDFVAAEKKVAAAKVGLSPTVLERAQEAGDLVAHYLGRKPVYRAVDLDAWIESLPTEKPETGRT